VKCGWRFLISKALKCGGPVHLIDTVSCQSSSLPVYHLPAMAITRSPYKGTSRKLVLAFDIGTTYSGVSYAFLDPGVVPEIKGVTT